MNSRFHARLTTCLTLVCLWSIAVAEEPPATARTRTEEIAQTRAAIQQELQAAGGWEDWANGLASFREDIERIAQSNRWPWPAERGFVFQGAALRMLRADEVPHAGDVPPLEGIVHLNRQLQARGIDLIVMIIPNKLAIYPDYLSEQAPETLDPSLAMKRLMLALLEQDVEVVDLYRLYRDHRRSGDSRDVYYQRDSHWNNYGAQLAAAEVGRRLQRYDWVRPDRTAEPRYTTRPERRTDGNKADDLLIVTDRTTGNHFQPVGDSPILVTGDSHMLYNQHNGASVFAHIGRHADMPVTLLSREGLSTGLATDLANLDRQRNYLDGRKVIVWSFTDRMLPNGRWSKATLAPGPAVVAEHGGWVTGFVQAVSEGPDSPPPYANFFMKFHLTELATPDGQQVGAGQAVVRIQALRDRELLPAAGIQPGTRLRLHIEPWERFEEPLGQVHTGSLEAELEITLPHYLGRFRTD